MRHQGDEKFSWFLCCEYLCGLTTRRHLPELFVAWFPFCQCLCSLMLWKHPPGYFNGSDCGISWWLSMLLISSFWIWSVASWYLYVCPFFPRWCLCALVARKCQPDVVWSVMARCFGDETLVLPLACLGFVLNRQVARIEVDSKHLFAVSLGLLCSWWALRMYCSKVIRLHCLVLGFASSVIRAEHKCSDKAADVCHVIARLFFVCDGQMTDRDYDGSPCRGMYMFALQDTVRRRFDP